MTRAYKPSDIPELLIGTLIVSVLVAFLVGLACLAIGCSSKGEPATSAETSTVEGVARIDAAAEAAAWDLEQALGDGAKMWRAFVASAKARVAEIAVGVDAVKASNQLQLTAHERQLLKKDAVIRDLEQQIAQKTRDQITTKQAHDDEIKAFKRKYRRLGVETLVLWNWFVSLCVAGVIGFVLMLIFSNMTNAGWIGALAKKGVGIVAGLIFRKA